MRILILNNEYPPLGGGAGVISQKYARGLAELGHEVTVLTAWFKGEEEDALNNGVRVVRLKSKRKNEFKSGPAEFVSWLFAAKKYLKVPANGNQFDLSIANYLLPSGEVSLFLKRKFGIPYVVVSHGHDVPFAFPKQMLKFHLLSYFRLKRIAKGAEIFFHQSSEMKGRADKFLGRKYAAKNIIVPNGCDTEAFYPNTKLRENLFTILFVGRLVDQKDPFTFLKAVKRFSASGLDFRVRVHGDGPLKEKMEEFVKENQLEHRFHFTGWLTKEELLKSYQSAHIQVISSVFEGMSITVLEALACGLFLISTRVSGNPDVIAEGKNGTFVDFRNEDQIRSKLKDCFALFENQSIEVELAFLNAFRKKYDWKNIVALYNERIEQLNPGG